LIVPIVRRHLVRIRAAREQLPHARHVHGHCGLHQLPFRIAATLAVLLCDATT
jgi:hypothetical protein